MAHDVFISYSSKDKPVADAACATLELSGIRCWIAPRDVLPGMDWSGSIIQAIEQSRVMVLIFSSSANGSVQIKREVNEAIEKEVPVIPFRIEDVKPSGSMGYYLDVTHWLDALTPPLEQHLEKLAEDVNLLLNRTGTQHNTPQPRRNALEPKREPARSRTRLWIGAVVAALVLAVLIGIVVERTGRRRVTENTNSPVPDNPSPSPTPRLANSQNPKPDQRVANRPIRTPPVVSGSCISGYVWREAGPGDLVCVRPEVRDKVASQNALAASRRDPRGGSYGPNTCLSGYVWRGAFRGDQVCVTPQERDEVANDNAQAAARVAH
ncbi:MAG TPA: toll/interleukin-1 receptor domain-containing protein [Blastocatellia bacterium]|nr:toll/interleukin-1 receptor domain-containing protein [Blastocatellia bacterium]